MLKKLYALPVNPLRGICFFVSYVVFGSIGSVSLLHFMKVLSDPSQRNALYDALIMFLPFIILIEMNRYATKKLAKNIIKLHTGILVAGIFVSCLLLIQFMSYQNDLIFKSLMDLDRGLPQILQKDPNRYPHMTPFEEFIIKL